MVPVLEARGVGKRFSGVAALDGVSVRIQSGEVLAVVGENGAGKSTLMKILAGIYRPDSGEVLIDGQPVVFHDARDAMRRGIVLIHQELNLAEPLSVCANLFLGRERLRGGFFLDRGAMTMEGARLLDKVGLKVPLHRRVADLPPGQRQLIEIARALAIEARVLILDEPTASLSLAESELLFATIRQLKASGVAVVYISHRLAEVTELADRVSVLRDGRPAGELWGASITHDNLVRHMVGREIQSLYARKHRPTDDAKPRLEVRGFRYAGGPMTPVSLSVRTGEVVGLGGLVGAGRTELVESLFGLRRIVAGEVRIDGEPCVPACPGDAIDRGLLLAPEDRREHGLHLGNSVERNLSLPNLDRWSRAGLVDRPKVHREAVSIVERLRIRLRSLRQPAVQLSGGNQQKIVFGKWLARGPQVFVLDEPTRGVDVGARGEIYALIDDLAGAGVAVLMVTSDMEELLGLSDRILVMHEGRLTGKLARPNFSEAAVMRLATGAR